MSNESMCGEEPGLVALLTRLGWVLSGQLDSHVEETRSTTNSASTYFKII